MLRIRFEVPQKMTERGTRWLQTHASIRTNSCNAVFWRQETRRPSSTIGYQTSSYTFSARERKSQLFKVDIKRDINQLASLRASSNVRRPSIVSGPSVSGHHYLNGGNVIPQSRPSRRFYSSKPPTDESETRKGETQDDEKADARHRLAKLVGETVVPTLKRVEESVIPTLKRVEDSVKPTLKRVSDWYAGDLAAIYAIALLFIFVVTAPMVARHMRKSDVEYDVDSEDVVAHTEILARQILFNLEGENGEKVGPNIPRAADLLQAILSSETLKDAVIKLISKVMDSEEFQTSAKELVRNLWNDLVEDPETTAQVVHLLNHAIQTVEIQNAAQELVIKVVNDKDVFDELIQLLNRIGQEHQVLEAVQKLLLQSAHNALNDEEILDHSMEFVADVVADDTIQRTTGDALRHTISHAARPAFSAFLIATGLGFLLFSLSALSSARLSDRELKLLEQSMSQVSASVHMGVAQAIPTVLSVTGRLLAQLENALFYSLRTSGSALSQLGITTWNASTRMLVHFPLALAHSIGSLFIWSRRSVTNGLVVASTATISSISLVLFNPTVALRKAGTTAFSSMWWGIARIASIVIWPFRSTNGSDNQDYGSGDSTIIKVKLD